MSRIATFILTFALAQVALADGYGPGSVVDLAPQRTTGGEIKGNELFDHYGKPTSFADEYTDAHHLPRLLEGAPYKFPEREKFEKEPGCVAVQFLIKADGHTDKFVVVDSKPKGAFDQTVLDSLKFWRFDSREERGWVTWTERFYFGAPTGSRLGVKAPECAATEVRSAGSFPAKVAHEIRPYFPPALAAKGAQGCAVIGFSVINGVADEYEVIDAVPDGDKDFVQAGLQALNRWKFEAGADPKARGYVSFTFGLKDAAAPARACKVPSDAKKGA